MYSANFVIIFLLFFVLGVSIIIIIIIVVVKKNNTLAGCVRVLKITTLPYSSTTSLACTLSMFAACGR